MRYIGKNETGQGLAEYVIIVIIIAIAAISILSFVAGGVQNLLHTITDIPAFQ